MFLRRFWVLIAAVVIVGTTATILYALRIPHTWEAVAVVRVETPAIAGDTVGTAQPRLTAARLQQIQQDILSRDGALDLIARYGLFADLPQFTLNDKIHLARMSVTFMPTRPEGAPFGPEQPITGIVIFSRQADPHIAADIANDMAAQLVAQSSALQSSEVAQTLTFLAVEEARLGAEILALEAEVTAFRNANIDALPEDAQSRRDAIARLDDEIRTQTRDLAPLQQELAGLQARRNLRAVEQRQLEALETQVNAQARSLTALQDQRARLDALNARAPAIDSALASFARRQQLLDEQLATIIRRRVEAETTQRLTSQAQTERFELLESALPPDDPMRSARRKTAAMGGIASVVLALALAFVLDLRNPALRTSRQFEAATAIRPVIAIPNLGKPQKRGGGDAGKHTLKMLMLGGAALWAGAVQAWGWARVVFGAARHALARHRNVRRAR